MSVFMQECGCEVLGKNVERSQRTARSVATSQQEGMHGKNDINTRMAV